MVDSSASGNRLMPHIDVSEYQSSLSTSNRLGRALWWMVWALLFRPSPRLLFGWRRFLLRLFGAMVGTGAHPYPSARIWAPWNLEMGEYSCLGPSVDCYCVAKITIGPHATISQYSYLCTAAHDIEDPCMRLVMAPINIGAGAWITADVFVGPGVTIGEGAVVGVRSTVLSDVEPWIVVAGTPARFIKRRSLRPLSLDGSAGLDAQ